MIQANVSAAETLEYKRQPLIFRIHEPPSLAKQEALREFLRTLDITLAKGTQLKPAQFNQILKRVEGNNNKEMVNQIVLRSQSQAEYSPDNIGHFGLNLPHYTHFTSPIRRYADLIVHRALIGTLGFAPEGMTPHEEKQLHVISALISATERRAMIAERETIDRLIAHYLIVQIGNNFHGRIASVTKAGLFVTLAIYGADGFVPISTLGQEYYHYDEVHHMIIGDHSRKGYRLGDSVEVRLVEALPIAGALRFEMITQPRPILLSKHLRHRSRRCTYHRKANPSISRNKRRRSQP